MLSHTEILTLLTLAQAAVQQHAPQDTVLGPLLQGLYEILSEHGPTVASTLLTLVPFALAKGDSKRQLDEVVGRYERDLPANVFIELDPTDKRFPTNVTETGRLGLANLSLVSTSRGTH